MRIATIIAASSADPDSRSPRRLRFAATGQQTHDDGTPYVCVWDVDTMCQIQRLDHPDDTRRSAESSCLMHGRLLAVPRRGRVAMRGNLARGGWRRGEEAVRGDGGRDEGGGSNASGEGRRS